MDENAWDLVADEPVDDEIRDSLASASEGASDEERSAEPSSHAINEDAENEPEKTGRRRSKSPAIDSLRKVSRLVLQKFTVRRHEASPLPGAKKKSIQQHQLLAPRSELKIVPLDDACVRPIVVAKNDDERFELKKGKKARKDATETLSSGGGKEEHVGTADGSQKCAHLFSEAEERLKEVSASASQRQQAEGDQRGSAEANAERAYKYDAHCPVHGSRRRLKRRRLVDMHNLVASVETANPNHEELSPILDSQAYLAKMLRKRRRAFLSGAEKIHADKTKRKIMANLWIISVAFLFLFTGFNGLQNLQTTVNGQMGADALGVFYVSLAISSLFVPSFALDRLGTKMTLITAIGVHILYMLANFIPRYYSLIPASVLAGAAASCLWAAKCVYITESGIKYAKLNVEAQNVVIIRFFGYFFMIVHLGQVVGNVLSSLILSEATTASVAAHQLEDRVDETCGHNYLSAKNGSWGLSERARQNLARPPQVTFLLVVGVDLCCAFIALLIVLLFLNALRSDQRTLAQAPSFNMKVLSATARNLKRPKVLLLIPLTIFNGVEQAFIVGRYTKAYVACGLGVAQIGYVMTSFGVADAICSLVFGPLIKLFGRMPLFVFGCVINMLMIMTLMIWPLNPGDRALFNAIAGVWGMADGVWNTQLNGFWVGLLGRESLELAFANYRVWTSSGLALGFFLIRFTNIYEYLVVAFCFLLIGILGYFALELYDMFVEFLFTFANGENSQSKRKQHQQQQERKQQEKQQEVEQQPQLQLQQ